MCIYRQNTTIFISSVFGIYYIRHNYMFRPLMLGHLQAVHELIE